MRIKRSAEVVFKIYQTSLSTNRKNVRFSPARNWSALGADFICDAVQLIFNMNFLMPGLAIF